jgi:dGTP triphosphohydrolase
VRRSLLKGRIPDGFPAEFPTCCRSRPLPLEAHLVDLCDKIAYLSHDLDDGLRAGLFAEEEAAELGCGARPRAAPARTASASSAKSRRC